MRIISGNLNKLDILKAQNAEHTFAQVANNGEKYHVTGGVIYETVDKKTGEVIEITSIRTEEIGFIAGNSTVVKNVYETVAEYLNDKDYDGKPPEVRFSKGTTKGEKEYTGMSIV